MRHDRTRYSRPRIGGEAMRIWFHGTERDAAQKISEFGFSAGSWFAEHLEDAIEFGGPYVFEVALAQKPVVDGNWQMKIADPVEARSIVRLTHHSSAVLEDHPERRTAVFEASEGKSDGPQ